MVFLSSFLLISDSKIGCSYGQLHVYLDQWTVLNEII